jgi:paraquat-inducible protein A
MQSHQTKSAGKSISSSVSGRDRYLGVLILLFPLVFPVTWFLPLLTTTKIIFKNDVSLYSGCLILLQSEIFLFVVVALFGGIVPMIKFVLLIWLWYGANEARARRLFPVMYLMDKFSMLDIFLVALLVVMIKGLGGDIEIRYGCYVFIFVVLAASVVSARIYFLLQRATPNQTS